MRVTDHQLHAVQTAGLQRAQKRGPKCAVLAVTDVKAQHLAASIGGHPGSHHDGLGHHTVVDSGLAVGGVEKHIPEWLVGQRPVPKRRDFDVELGADPAHFGLGDAGVSAQGLDQVVDLAG